MLPRHLPLQEGISLNQKYCWMLESRQALGAPCSCLAVYQKLSQMLRCGQPHEMDLGGLKKGGRSLGQDILLRLHDRSYVLDSGWRRVADRKGQGRGRVFTSGG